MKCYSSEDILGEPQSQRMRQGRRQIAACRRIHKPTCSRDRERAKHEISKQRTVLDIGWLSGAKTADRLIAPSVNIILSLAVRQLRCKQSRTVFARNNWAEWRAARTKSCVIGGSDGWSREIRTEFWRPWVGGRNELIQEPTSYRPLKFTILNWFRLLRNSTSRVYDWNLFGSLALTWRQPGYEAI